MHEYIVSISMVTNKHWKLIRTFKLHSKATKFHFGNIGIDGEGRYKATIYFLWVKSGD